MSFNVGYLFGKLNNNTLAYQLNQYAPMMRDAYTTWSFTNTKWAASSGMQARNTTCRLKVKERHNKVI